MGGAFVSMRVAVDVVAMPMRMLVDRVVIVSGADIFDRAKRRPQVERAEQDQHQGDAKFEAHPEAFRHHNTKEDNCAANDEQGQAVADSPKNPGPCCAPDAALPAHDGGNRDDVVGIGRMSHPEEKPEEQNGQKRGHEVTLAISLGMNRMERMAHSSPSVTRVVFPQSGHSRVATGTPCKAPSQYFGGPL